MIDFTPPWPRYSYIEELEKQGGFKIPMPLDSEECHSFLAAKCKELEIEVTPPQTTPRLLDKLVEHFVERLCLNPSFICDQPEICSPLAKYHRSKPGMCERFELFVNYTELTNAYTELNNPMVQRERFMQQAKDKSNGDEEAQCLDEDFCVALEHGRRLGSRRGSSRDVPDRQQQHQGSPSLPRDEAHRGQQARGDCLVVFVSILPFSLASVLRFELPFPPGLPLR